MATSAVRSRRTSAARSRSAATRDADLDLAADVRLDLTAEVALDLVVGFDGVAELHQLVVAQLVDPGVRVHAGDGQQLLGAGTADAVDVGECDLDPLVAGEIDTDEACHVLAVSLRSSGGVGRVASRVCTRAPASDPGVTSPVSR